jgi:hypothetical protein
MQRIHELGEISLEWDSLRSMGAMKLSGVSHFALFCRTRNWANSSSVKESSEWLKPRTCDEKANNKMESFTIDPFGGLGHHAHLFLYDTKSPVTKTIKPPDQPPIGTIHYN